MFGKPIIALVAGGNGHHRARAVARQYIVGQENGHLFIVHRIQAVATREHPRNSFHIGHPVAFRAEFGRQNVGLHRFALLVGGQARHEFMLRSQHHKRHAVDGIDASGEDFDNSPFRGGYRKFYACPHTPPNPVTLLFFERFGPVDGVEAS